VGDYNPYAAPVAAPTHGGGGPPISGEPQPWSIGAAISGGWEAYKTHWAPLTFGCIVVTLIGAVPGQVAPTLSLAGSVEEDTAAYYAIHAPLSIVGWLVSEFFMAGFTRAAMRTMRANDVSFGDFFAAGSRFFDYVGMSLLKTLALALASFPFVVAVTLAALRVVDPIVAVAAVVFLVPGVIVGLGLTNAPFFVIDQNLGSTASLKASWESTKGQKGHLLVLALAEVGVMILGVVACCIGVFAAVPVMLLARAIVYMRMTGTAPPPAAPPGPYGAPGPLPGSYGHWGAPGGYGGGGYGGGSQP